MTYKSATKHHLPFTMLIQSTSIFWLFVEFHHLQFHPFPLGFQTMVLSHQHEPIHWDIPSRKAPIIIMVEKNNCFLLTIQAVQHIFWESQFNKTTRDTQQLLLGNLALSSSYKSKCLVQNETSSSFQNQKSFLLKHLLYPSLQFILYFFPKLEIIPSLPYDWKFFNLHLNLAFFDGNTYIKKKHTRVRDRNIEHETN